MRILFVTSNRIGDAVLSTGLLDHLLRKYPEARLAPGRATGRFAPKTVAHGFPAWALFRLRPTATMSSEQDPITVPQAAPLDPIHAKALFKALPSLALFEQDGVLQAQQAIAGETIYDIYDPANGQLEYVFIGRPDGSSTVIQYDTENQHSWSVAVFDANPQGQLVDVTVDNRDGSYSKEYFDAQLPGDPETQLDYVNADGSWKAFLYDPGNTQRWSSALQYFSAAGQEISATFNLRTGGTEDQVYDQAHGDALQTDL